MTRPMHRDHGAAIPLWDDDQETEPHTARVIVRGHVSDAEAAEAVAHWWAEHGDEDEPCPVHGLWRRAWARWCWESGPGGPMRTIRTYRDRSRGTFPVTIAHEVTP